MNNGKLVKRTHAREDVIYIVLSIILKCYARLYNIGVIISCALSWQ